jgi:hypothetical protein
MANLVSYSFNRLPPKDMGTFTNNVIQQMTGDAQFLELMPHVTLLKSLYEPFWAAYNDALKGGTDRRNRRDETKEAMRIQLNTVALLVEVLAKGRSAVIEAAGFELRKTTRTSAPPVSPPTNLFGEKGPKTASLALNWKAGEGSISFDVQIRLKGNGEWKTIKQTTLQSIILYDLELGKCMEVRICAQGRGETSSDYTQPIEVWIS